MADVHCPESKSTRPMDDCRTCGFHIKNGTSLEWCGYRKPVPERVEIPINALRMQMNASIEKAEYLYKRGKTKAADNYSHEAGALHREIRRRENEKRSS